MYIVLQKINHSGHQSWSETKCHEFKGLMDLERWLLKSNVDLKDIRVIEGEEKKIKLNLQLVDPLPSIDR